MTSPVIYWFRQDLRLRDLPGLSAALATGRPVLACYILDEESPGQWQMGGASRWWLHHSLAALARDIAAVGGQLYLARGRPDRILADLAESTGADLVCCSRQYEPWARQLEAQLHVSLGSKGVELKRYPGSLLFEPETVQNQAGQPFKVFTPFWRKCRSLPLAPVSSLHANCGTWYRDLKPAVQLRDWELLPHRPNWAQGWEQWWQPGEQGAAIRLEAFLQRRRCTVRRGQGLPGAQSDIALVATPAFWRDCACQGFSRGATGRCE